MATSSLVENYSNIAIMKTKGGIGNEIYKFDQKVA